MGFPSVSAVFAAASAGFVDTNAREFRKERFELLPDPLGENFAGWVFQARNIIEIVVVKLLVKRLENSFDFGEITNPAGVWVYLTFDINRHAKRVAV